MVETIVGKCYASFSFFSCLPFSAHVQNGQKSCSCLTASHKHSMEKIQGEEHGRRVHHKNCSIEAAEKVTGLLLSAPHSMEFPASQA